MFSCITSQLNNWSYPSAGYLRLPSLNALFFGSTQTASFDVPSNISPPIMTVPVQHCHPFQLNILQLGIATSFNIAFHALYSHLIYHTPNIQICTVK